MVPGMLLWEIKGQKSNFFYKFDFIAFLWFTWSRSIEWLWVYTIDLPCQHDTLGSKPLDRPICIANNLLWQCTPGESLYRSFSETRMIFIFFSIQRKKQVSQKNIDIDTLRYPIIKIYILSQLSKMGLFEYVQAF